MKKQCGFRLCKVIFCFKSLQKITRPPVISTLFWKPKWKENGVQTAKCITKGTQLQNGDTCTSKKLKHRNFDGETTECRLCKH